MFFYKYTFFPFQKKKVKLLRFITFILFNLDVTRQDIKNNFLFTMTAWEVPEDVWRGEKGGRDKQKLNNVLLTQAAIK